MQQDMKRFCAGNDKSRTITATARVYVIVPCAPNLVALFDDDEVASQAIFDQIDGGA